MIELGRAKTTLVLASLVACASVQLPESFAASKTCDLVFPKDKSVGILHLVGVTPGGLVIQPNADDPAIKCIGTIKVPCEQALSFTPSYDGARDLSYLDKMPGNLAQIDFHNLETVTDSGLGHLQNKTTLVRIILDGTDVSDAALKNFSKLVNLNNLPMNNTLVTGTGFAFLRNLPKLRSLSLDRCPIKDCSGLRELKSLYSLKISNCNLNNEALKYVSEMPSLTLCDVAYNPINNAGVAFLSKSKTIQSLNLSETHISAGCIKYLKSMPSLVQLELSNRLFSEASVRELKAALPRCHIKIPQTRSKIDSSLFTPLH